MSVNRTHIGDLGTQKCNKHDDVSSQELSILQGKCPSKQQVEFGVTSSTERHLRMTREQRLLSRTVLVNH